MAYNLLNAKGSSAIPMTPFTESDQIDEEILAREIEFIIKCGSTSISTPILVSEFETLSERERKLMVKIPAEIAGGRIAIIANVMAPCTPQAVEYAEYAQKCGADAVVAMAPAEQSFANIRDYFKKISDAVTIPIMIQNHSLHGTQLTPEQIIRLCEEIENVSWVKQEVIPGPIGIEHLMSIKTPALEGVMSGFGGFYSPLDYTLGAVATIHACEICDVVQKVWNLLLEGNEYEARILHNKIMPLIQLELLYGTIFAKEIMIRRGIFRNRKVRNKGDLSPIALREIDIVWENILPLFDEV
jgi:4-hydroxy-tetrahydrodipicolinate synthase